MTDFKGVTKRALIQALAKLYAEDNKKSDVISRQERKITERASFDEEFAEYYGMSPKKMMLLSKIEELKELRGNVDVDIERLQAEFDSE